MKLDDTIRHLEELQVFGPSLNCEKRDALATAIDILRRVRDSAKPAAVQIITGNFPPEVVPMKALDPPEPVKARPINEGSES